MNSKIRKIVNDVLDCACSQTARERERLIRELEAYHDKAMVEAADGALVGRAALDRALGRDVSLDVRPGAQSPGDAVRDYVAGMVDDLRARREGCDGMSQRDYFAASALQGLLAGYVAASGDPESEARFAYKIADAMLRAREATT